MVAASIVLALCAIVVVAPAVAMSTREHDAAFLRALANSKQQHNTKLDKLKVARAANVSRSELLRISNERVGEDDDLCGLVRSFDLRCEEHEVQTADGFVLQMIHVPANEAGGYPVILQHGLLDAAETWFFNAHAYQNLGNMLHDQGYDLWMPNSRGNKYSMKNTKYTQDEWKYWDSIDCDLMAMYDMPASIDYVLQQRNRTTLSWVGHSQGTWQMFAGMSTTRREYAPKVDLFVALAPVGYVGHQKSVLMSIIASWHVDAILDIVGSKEFLLDEKLMEAITAYCKDLNCPSVMEVVMGDGNVANVNSTQLHTMAKYVPAGTSTNNLVHWMQMVRSGKFQMHDYGGWINSVTYGNWDPPQYHPVDMTAPPTVLYSGLSDNLADPTDVAYMKSLLQNKSMVDAKEFNDYAHLDFVWGLDAHERLYPDVIKQLAKYAKR